METAYAVWTGIGAAGIAVISMSWFGESVNIINRTDYIMDYWPENHWIIMNNSYVTLYELKTCTHLDQTLKSTQSLI